MNTFNLLYTGVTARFVAAITVVSLLLSAFPAAFFVALAANTDAVGSVTLEVSPTSNPGEQATVSFAGTGTLDLENWSLWDIETSNRNVFTFGATTLTDGQSFTICNGGCDGQISGGSTVFNDGGDTTELKDDSGNVIVSVTWSGAGGGDTFSAAEAVDYAPGPVENTDTNETFATVQEAIDDADTDNGDTIVMSADETTSAQITINKEITLDGGGYTIDAAFTKTDNSNNAAIGIVGTNNVTVQNIVLDGSNGTDLHGLNVYESTGITVDNVTAKNFRSGMVVNGSTVDASDFSSADNAWHGINVVPGRGVTMDSILNISNTSMHDEYPGGEAGLPVPHIFTDNINAGPTIEVNDIDDQYEFTDFPLVLDEVVAVQTVTRVQEPQVPTARAYFLKEVILGCTDDAAYNYDPEANEDDGSCVYRPVSQCIDPGQNLLQNGSFEDPEVTAKRNWDKFAAVPGWTITEVSDGSATTLELQLEELFKNEPADGDQYAELDGDHSTQISQSVVTDRRATYELSWAFAGRHGLDPSQNQMDVLVNGSSVATEGPQTDPKGLDRSDWTYSAVTFEADTDTTEIAFADLGPSNSFGTYVDNVQLCLVEEPAPAPEICSYEGTVVSATQGLTNGGAPVAANRSDVAAVEAGVAAYTNFFGKEGNDWQVNPLDFYSLGIGGDITYEFTDKIAVDQPGDDIAIWEITGGNPAQQANESVDVYLSADGINFEMAGSVTGDGSVDIADTTLLYVKFVKLVDTSQGVQGRNGDGYDLDGITIIEGSCDDYVTVNTSKIVCDYESELPNMSGGANITETTAADWLAANDDTSCRLVDGWEFEWADRGTKNPGNQLVGYGGSDWTTFTDSTMVPLSLVNGKSFWMREVLQPDYIPFSKKNKDDVSAEMYCHKDVLNYDNFDRVDGPKAGGEYYCVAWNVPVAPSCELEIKSDSGTLVIENNDYAVETYVHRNWTDDIDATWVWATETVENPEQDEMYTFAETFVVNSVKDAVIEIAADNGYVFTVNGTEVADRSDQNNFGDQAVKSFDITSLLVDGENTFTIKVNNKGVDGSNYRSNPAGVLYKLVVNAGTDCEVTTEPEPEMMTIEGEKVEIIDGEEFPGEGWVIEVYAETDDAKENVLASTTTGVDGSYSIELPIGDYDVYEVMQDGWTQVDVVRNGVSAADEAAEFNEDFQPYCEFDYGAPVIDDNIIERVVSILVDDQDDDEEEQEFRCDFYNERDEVDQKTIRIDGYKFEAGVESEAGLAGWTIELKNGEGATLMSTTTDESGYYYFDVVEGYYEVHEVMQTDWEQVFVDVLNGSATTDQDVNYCTFEVYDDFIYYEDVQSARIAIDDDYYYDYECDFTNRFNEPDEEIEEEEPSSSSGGRRNRSTPTPQVLGASTDTCPFLVDYMQMGADNDPMEVMKLQLFLNIFKDLFGGTENPVTGNFGIITDTNVKTFQAFYKNEVLTPWFSEGIVGHEKPTGFVYKTTLWKINDIVCEAVFPSLEGETLETNVDLNARAVQD